MTTTRQSAIRLALLAALITGLAACSGGNGGGGSANSGSPLLFAVRLIDVPDGSGGFTTIELWNDTAGQLPNPPGNIPLNGTIEFEFAGNVDASSLPQGGLAVGTINVTTSDGTSTTAAVGSFSVTDAPAAPPGNARIVRFTPNQPLSSASPATTAGLQPNAPYTVFIPRSGNSTQVVNVAGQALQNDAVADFVTCDPATGGAQACFTDPTPGSPFVVMTTPGTSDPSPTPVDPNTVINNTVSVFISEGLYPIGIDVTYIRVINSASGAQVPGAVQFFQVGTPEAGPEMSRIDYVASASLLSNVTYEIEIDPAIVDFGGQSVVQYDPSDPTAPASGRRFFQTLGVLFCPQPVFSESFDTVNNRDSVSGIASWDGSGALTGAYPIDLTGDGSFGNLVFGPGPQTLDTGMPMGPGFQDGNWDTIDVVVSAGAMVRAQGAYRAHIRCLGSAIISGSINGNAGMNPSAPPGTPEQGPQSGAFNNGGSPANSTILGGIGGVGGGDGGDASNAGFTTRTDQGQNGFGPTINGLVNPGPAGSNGLFAGGAGGDGGFRFPAGGSQGERGGLGGAGGTAWEMGEDGIPHTSPAMGCLPTTPLVQPISFAAQIPAVFIPPITVASAGSGGGGGGDRFEISGPTNDDQGGGGGGGGGGLRISAIAQIDIVAGASLSFDGATGGNGNLFFGGGGGGGSGGQIWLQSFTDVNVSPSATLSVNPGNGANACNDHSAGDGGFGLFQFEDPSGMPNTSFIPAGGGTGGANIVTVQFPYTATTMTGTATSVFFDTGYGAPDFDASTVVETTSFGANPPAGAAVVVEYQGAFESLTGGQPDLSTLTSWVAGTNLDLLDGRRFVRFRVTMTVPSPNAAGTGTLPANTLPSVDQISFGYSSPIGCATP